MAILSWGKCTISTAPSSNGAPSGTWRAIDTPKEDTTKVIPTAGAKKTATEEGGAIVDSIVQKNSYQLEFDIFVKKGYPRPFEDDDGIIAGEHAFRIVPEDESCEGSQIDRVNLHVEESYSTADGKMLHYVGECLKPAEGKIVKPYTAGGLVVDKNKLYFTSAADSTGKTVTATSTGNVTASSSADWCTVSCSGKITTVKVTANSTGQPRTAYVTIMADGKATIVEVLQIPA